MIKSFTIINYLGDSIYIDVRKPEQSGFLISSVSGLGPAQATINSTEIATNDGSIFNSARLSQRNIVFYIYFEETENGETIEDVRQKTYKYFPLKKQVVIVIETDKRIVYAVGYVESNEPGIFSRRESTQISIICPDPFFYSTGEEGTMRTTFYGVEGEFEFPFSNESLTEKLIQFGTTRTLTQNVIVYPGDSETGVIIRIHAIGEASNVTLYNVNTREVMKIDTTKLKSMTGSEIIAGDDIVIDTVKGEKSATLLREGVTTNILNCLNKDADWFVLTKGDNLFAFDADKGAADLQVVMENCIVYEGI